MLRSSVSDTDLEEALSTLESLCAISSASGDVGGLRRMAARLAAELEPFGFSSEIREVRGGDRATLPLLVARGPRSHDGYVLLIGHLDTVLPAAPPQRDPDRLCATGALDMKGGFAALIGALRLLVRRDVTLPTNLVLVAVPDEEVGGPISESAVREWGGGASLVLVLEPGERRDDAETLVTGRRGLIGWRLRAQGRSAHSGLAYWQGRSAVAAAATWCGQVQLLSEPGEGPVVNVGRILGGDAEFVDELAEHHTLVGTNYRLNIVADRCVAEGEVRFLKTADRDRLLERMRALAREIEARSEVAMRLEVFESIQPVEPTEPGCRLAETLVRRAAEHGWILELEHDRGGVSFPNFLPDPSRATVLDGLGPVGGGMHTREEYLDLRSLRRRTLLLADLFEMLATIP